MAAEQIVTPPRVHGLGAACFLPPATEIARLVWTRCQKSHPIAAWRHHGPHPS
jgi:hypothetical protein